MARIMPNMYQTTYNTYFTKPVMATKNTSNFARHPNSIYAIDSPLPPLPPSPQDTSPANSTMSRSLPAGANFQPNRNIDDFGDKSGASIVKANVQRSGFWSENPVTTAPCDAKGEFLTTNMEVYDSAASKSSNINYKNLRLINKTAFKAATPFTRQPVLAPFTTVNNDFNSPSNSPSAASNYTTTQQESFKKYDIKTSPEIPSTVVMEPTGFQRGYDSSVGPGHESPHMRLANCEVEKMKRKDPVGYLSAKSNDNPYISVNQLCYTQPQRRRPF
ncbi:hypothetical protein TRFO_01560 [Tritrichomonas foetus]|uniref:Uncharacterized protein n=1 Tax=Tritrichomonas foetus TaxID=1144522 RepID=A0A1J4K275_9EUKA|nr:hypothetical protein TRFO_01560 [Tritrichomonas foetus]|eukprot:OHT03844.1 hypothetical protein TRFO_01560 [Tritrichomonas foetus]